MLKKNIENLNSINLIAQKFSVILLILLPFTLLTGNFIPDLSIVFISIVFVSQIIQKKEFEYFNNKYFYFFITLYLIFCFTSIISEKPLVSLSSSFVYLRFGIFSLAVVYLLEKNDQLIKYFTIFLFFTFIFALIDGYYQFFFDQSIFGYVAISPNRMVLPLNDKQYMGGYLARLFPLLFALFIYNFKHSKVNIIVCCILLIVTDILVFITGERTALGLMLISTILFMTLLSNFKLIRFFTVILSFITIIIISIYSPEITKRNINYTLEQLEISSNLLTDGEINFENKITNKPRIFSIEHEGLFITSYNMFKENLFFGIGPNLFRYYCEETVYDSGRYSCSTHPHNSYVQLAAEVGLIGLFFPLFLFLYLIFLFIKILSKKIFSKKIIYTDTYICLMVCLFLSLWPFFPTQNFFNGYINIIYYLPIGFILYLKMKKLHKKIE